MAKGIWIDSLLARKIFFGDTEVAKAYYGTKQIFPVFKVLITAGTGITDVGTYDKSAPRQYDIINPSGWTYTPNTTVYGFATLAADYKVLSSSGWTLITGAPNRAGARYRVGSTTITDSDYDFGTKSATAKAPGALRYSAGENCSWSSITSDIFVEGDYIYTLGAYLHCQKQTTNTGLSYRRFSNYVTAPTVSNTTWTYSFTAKRGLSESTATPISLPYSVPEFDSSITSPGIIWVTPIATANSTQAYTITFSVSGGYGGSWGSGTKTAYYGDYIYRSGSTVYCKIGSSLGEQRWSNTFTPPADTGTYEYSTSYTTLPVNITAAKTITATVSQSSACNLKGMPCLSKGGVCHAKVCTSDNICYTCVANCSCEAKTINPFSTGGNGDSSSDNWEEQFM